MLHPIFRTLVSRPHLVIEHLGGYADLVSIQLREAAGGLRARALLLAGIGLCALLGLVLGGMALLLYAAIPPASMHLPWLMWVVPLVPWALVLLLWLMLRAQQRSEPPFEVVREQFEADMALLREVSR